MYFYLVSCYLFIVYCLRSLTVLRWAHAEWERACHNLLPSLTQGIPEGMKLPVRGPQKIYTGKSVLWFNGVWLEKLNLKIHSHLFQKWCFFPLYVAFQGLAAFPAHWMTTGAGNHSRTEIAVFLGICLKLLLRSIHSNESLLTNDLPVHPINTWDADVFASLSDAEPQTSSQPEGF